MIQTIYIPPKTDLKTKAPSEERIEQHISTENEDVRYTIAYVGPYTYTNKVKIDNNMQVCKKDRGVPHNFHIGRGNSLGVDLRCVFGRNHNTKRVTSGGLETNMQYSGIPYIWADQSNFRQKGSIILQNDIWIGDNVTIMSGCIVRNGAVIAQNSHVVKDVPAYAIMGGNPAKVIGWRFPKDIIEKLQTIQWWYWDHDKILCNYEYFTEDVEDFCDRFYDEAKQQFDKLSLRRNVKDDAYFVYVDYYENYSSYPAIIEEFLDTFLCDSNKRLILFVQTDVAGGGGVIVNEEAGEKLRRLVEDVNESPEIKCRLEMVGGNREDAVLCLMEASHFITTRTYNTVYTTCLADQFGIEIISGVDKNIPFKSDGYNMIREVDR